MHYYWLLWLLPTLLLVIDCAKNRRDPVWFFVLGFLGPLGAVAYTVYFWESITFPVPIAQLVRGAGKQTQKRCPHCGRWVDRLHSMTDGRAQRTICAICRDHLESSRT
ncbi:hypothetical protein IV102_00920 [bacterium]|nr:hypothetical protein [bacterium]